MRTENTLMPIETAAPHEVTLLADIIESGQANVFVMALDCLCGKDCNAIAGLARKKGTRLRRRPLQRLCRGCGLARNFAEVKDFAS